MKNDPICALRDRFTRFSVLLTGALTSEDIG
jgi:hypothetical protein